MAGIKGSNVNKTNSYADTAQKNHTAEQEAMRLKREEAQADANKKLQDAMLAMVNDGQADGQAVPAQVQPTGIPTVAEVVPVQAQPTVAPTTAEVAPVQAQPTVAVAHEVAKVEVDPAIEKTKSKKSSSKKANGLLATFNDGAIQFNGQFLIKDTKSSESSTIQFTTPSDIALEVKIKASRDKLTLFELNNLLMALYLEKGIPKEFLERYRKSFN